jgi:hypothetical protein
MSESNAENVAQQVVETIVNATNSSANETEKFKATPEGLFVAYSSLLVMALLPIILGSFKSVKHQKKQQVGILFYFAKNFYIKSLIQTERSLVKKLKRCRQKKLCCFQ